MAANNYIGYWLLLKSAKKQFFVSIYLFFKFIIFKKLYRKKIKDNRALQLSHEENIQNHLRINEDWFSHNINTCYKNINDDHARSVSTTQINSIVVNKKRKN